jgi:hypothetical protein
MLGISIIRYIETKVTMRKAIPILLCALSFLLASNKAAASHAAGAEILYQWLHDSTYQIYFRFYRDCSGIEESATVSVCYSNTCDGAYNNLTLYKVTTSVAPGIANGSEISTDCSNLQTTCSTPAGQLPGFRVWVYTGNVTLPTRCDHWIFSTSIIARSGNITNMYNAQSANLQSIATIDNLNAQGNTSPFFLSFPLAYRCNNIPTQENWSAFDINNDSLVYYMIAPLGGSGCPPSIANIPLSNDNPAYNFTNNPFQTHNTFSCDSNSGMLSYTPIGVQSGAITMRIDEYRNQHKIGSVMRDMQMNVLNCGNQGYYAHIDSAHHLVNCYYSVTPDTLITYPGNAVHFDITSTGQPISDSVMLMAYPVGLASYTFNVPNNGKGKDTGTFSYIFSTNEIGLNQIDFKATDHTCAGLPMVLTTTRTVYVRVLPPLNNAPCNSFAWGNVMADSTDIGMFKIGNYVFGAGGSTLNNAAAIMQYYTVPDTLQLAVDSSYKLLVSEIVRTSTDAAAKLTLWMDLNQNGVYDRPNELLWTNYIYPGHDTAKLLFNMPGNAVALGGNIHGRLILNNNTGFNGPSDTACGNYASGETMDFVVRFHANTNSINSVNSTHYQAVVYPNPAQKQCTLSVNNITEVHSLKISVSNMAGQLLWRIDMSDIGSNYRQNIDLSAFAPGLYVITTEADGVRVYNKLVIE